MYDHRFWNGIDPEKVISHKTRSYGNEKTHLDLTGDAEAYASQTDCYEITEHVYCVEVDPSDDSNTDFDEQFRYTTPWTEDEMTEEELIKCLEESYREYQSEAEDDDDNT